MSNQYLEFTCSICNKNTKTWSDTKSFQHKVCGYTEPCLKKLKEIMQ